MTKHTPVSTANNLVQTPARESDAAAPGVAPAAPASPILLAFVRDWMENSPQARAMARVWAAKANEPVAQIGPDTRTRAA